MKQRDLLTITSLFSILLLVFHLTDDIARGFEKGTLSNLTAVPLFVIWLYGTLVLSGRRSGYIITLLFSLLGVGVPIIHMKGRGVGIGSSVYHSHGAYFFIWTLMAMGVTSLFSVILSVQGLWNLPWRRRH